MIRKHILTAALGAAVLTAASGTARADVRDDEIRALRDEIDKLDQKLRVLERKEEIREEQDTAAAKAQPQVKVNDKGVTIASGDNANVLRIRGLVQGDSRWFFDDNIKNNDAFLLRRARIILEGNFAKYYEYQLVPEFGGTSGNGTLTILDANININAEPGLQFRVGRFREPVGLEQLQSDSFAFFAERSIVSQFVPNRDVGAMLAGDVLDKKLSYAIGAFDGVADGQNNANDTDTNNDKDIAARLFTMPFRDSNSPLDGLGFGLAGTVGHQNSLNGGATGSLTTGYKTDGQQTWFSYRSTAVAQGETYRVSPQAYYYHGPLGLMAEYVVSSVKAINGTNAQAVRNEAWQLSAGYVLTGENSSYNGVVPHDNFSLEDGTWGAFEVVGRVEQAKIGDSAFAGGSLSLANPSTSAREANGESIGLNWYLSKTVRASFDFFHTSFDYAPKAAPTSLAVIKQDENAFVTRLQLIF